MFNQVNTPVMIIITVVPIDLLKKILDGLGLLFEKHSGVVFVADTAVSRLNYFVADQATAVCCVSPACERSRGHRACPQLQRISQSIKNPYKSLSKHSAQSFPFPDRHPAFV